MQSETWDIHVELFKQMKPPMRPEASEILLLKEIAATMVEVHQIPNLQVLLLGVTPEIVHLTWPIGTMLTAVDRSEIMIHHFWPGDVPKVRKMVRADWFEMPFAEGAFHLIIGDGVFNFMSYPDGYLKLSQILSSLLSEDGQLCIRIFNQLDHKESPKEVLQYLHEHEHVDYFEFRFRLATSLQESVEEGIYVTKETLDQYLVDHGVEMSSLYHKSGYTPPAIPPIPGAPSSNYRITYPTDEQYLTQVSQYFNEAKKLNGSHNLAYRTPIFVLSRRF